MLLSTPKTIRKECHISFRPHSLMNLKEKKTDFVYRYCQFYDLLSLILDTQRNCLITLRNGLSLLTTLRLILTLSWITQGNCLTLLLAKNDIYTYEWFIHYFTTYFLSQEGLHFHNLNIRFSRFENDFSSTHLLMKTQFKFVGLVIWIHLLHSAML